MITADSSEFYCKKYIYTRIIVPASCRLLLQKVQAMKNIKMVKKYRDGKGRARVVSQLTISVSDGDPMFLSLKITNFRSVFSHITQAGARSLTASQVYPWGFANHATWWISTWGWFGFPKIGPLPTALRFYKPHD